MFKCKLDEAGQYDMLCRQVSLAPLFSSHRKPKQNNLCHPQEDDSCTKLETERKLRVRVEARSSNGLACGDVRPDRGRPHGKVLNPDQEMCSWRVVIHETILEAPTPTGQRRRFQPWIRGIWRVSRQEGKCNP